MYANTHLYIFNQTIYVPFTTPPPLRSPPPLSDSYLLGKKNRYVTQQKRKIKELQIKILPRSLYLVLFYFFHWSYESKGGGGGGRKHITCNWDEIHSRNESYARSRRAPIDFVHSNYRLRCWGGDDVRAWICYR